MTLHNPSGTSATGVPYINMQPVIATGGLGQNSVWERLPCSSIIAGGFQFIYQPLLLASTNHAPVLDPIGPLSVFPGGVLKVPLDALDADGDSLTFTIPGIDSLPAGMLQNSTFIVRPTPGAQIGSYTFDVIASDGTAETSQQVTLAVAADPVTTTLVCSGKVLQVSGQPLVNMQVEIGGVNGQTGTDGFFQLDLGTAPAVSDTIRIREMYMPIRLNSQLWWNSSRCC